MNMKTAQGTLLQNYFDYRTDNVKMPKSKTPCTGISLYELSTKISRFSYNKEKICFKQNFKQTSIYLLVPFATMHYHLEKTLP